MALPGTAPVAPVPMVMRPNLLPIMDQPAAHQGAPSQGSGSTESETQPATESQVEASLVAESLSNAAEEDQVSAAAEPDQQTTVLAAQPSGEAAVPLAQQILNDALTARADRIAEQRAEERAAKAAGLLAIVPVAPPQSKAVTPEQAAMAKHAAAIAKAADASRTVAPKTASAAPKHKAAAGKAKAPAKAKAQGAPAEAKAGAAAKAKAPAKRLRSGVQHESSRKTFRVRLPDGSSVGFKYEDDTTMAAKKQEAERFLAAHSG